MERAPPAERIEVIDEECVVDHGTRRVSWSARVGDTWQRCATIEGAKLERLAAGPGTVWRTRIELELPRGTLLMRQVVSPTAPPPRDALSYLTGGTARRGQRLSYSYYSVRRGGAVDAAPADAHSSLHGMPPEPGRSAAKTRKS